MGDVVGIDDRHEGLVADLCEVLGATGSTVVDAEDLVQSDQTTLKWRSAARAAARRLGRPVQTGSTEHGSVWAVLSDWPATPQEAKRHQAQMRKAMMALSLHPGTGSPDQDPPATDPAAAEAAGGSARSRLRVLGDQDDPSAI